MTRASKTVTVGGGESETITLTFEAEATDKGKQDNATLTVSTTGTNTQDTRDITIPTSIPDDQLLIGTDSNEDTATFLPINDIETSADSITVTATVDADTRAALLPLTSGDVATVETAFGAYRRINRGGGGAVVMQPPESLRPPFEEREVHILSIDSSQLTLDAFELTLELGLDRPRAREPTPPTDAFETVDAVTVALPANTATSVTLTFNSTGETVGDRTVRAQGPRERDNDTATVTLTDTDWTFAFDVATLGLNNRQVGQINRTSDSGIERVTVPVRLSTSQVTELFAAGSRVAAVTTRTVPDGQNVTRDTLPSADATAAVQTPATSPIDGGTWALTDWSASYDSAASRVPFEAELSFAVVDRA